MFSCKIDAQTELRALGMDDKQQFFELVYLNREHLARWMFWVRSDYSLTDAEQHIAKALAQAAANDGFEAGIWFQGQLAGCISFKSIDWVHKTTELRYWLGVAFQGRGLAVRACRAFIDHAFNVLGLNRVEIRCMSETPQEPPDPSAIGLC